MQAWDPIDLRELARIEELRQGLGTSEVASFSEPIAGGVMCAERPGAWANFACGLGFEGPVSDAEVERLVAFYVTRGLEPRVDVTPHAHPTLLEALARRGFVLRAFVHCLARRIDRDGDLRAALSHGWPAGLEIERIDGRDAEAVRAYAAASAEGFAPEGAGADDTERELSRRVASQPSVHACVARVDGVLAGTGGMSARPVPGLEGSSVGLTCSLFGASVLPAFRRRGIQAALIVARMERARELGARVACLSSRPGIPTERNAHRLGFALAYVKCQLVLPGEGRAPAG